MRKIRTYVCVAAFAASAASAATQPLNIKNERIGMSEAQIKQLAGPNIDCGDAARRGFDIRQCTAAVNARGVTRESYAGESVNILRTLKRGATVDIYVCGLAPRNFDSVEAALVNKFGPPVKTQTEEVHNGYGAKYTNITSEWKADASTLTHSRYCGNLSRSCIELTSDEYAREKSTKAAAKAASDM